jgi:type VI secretion system protein ImpA
MINAEELLKPIAEEAPCGEDLSYDVALQELETMARGKEETQFSAAEPPDWKKLQARCIDLFARSKDLRIAVTLAATSIELDGLAGFRESLALVKGLIETYWTTVHPQLDPADDNDPLQRMNIVATLATPIGTFGDTLKILERLRALPLSKSVQMGSFNLGDILRAESGSPAQGDKPVPTTSQIEAGFRDSKPEELRQTLDLLNECISLEQAIDESITSSVGAARAPDLSLLAGELVAMRTRVASYVQGDDVPIPGAPGDTGAVARQSSDGRALSLDGEIRSRGDVIKLLEKICRFYEHTEPSSPVPLILKRAVRLANMDFMQIINDLTPDSISQIRTVTGEKPEE